MSEKTAKEIAELMKYAEEYRERGVAMIYAMLVKEPDGRMKLILAGGGGDPAHDYLIKHLSKYVQKNDPLA